MAEVAPQSEQLPHGLSSHSIEDQPVSEHVAPAVSDAFLENTPMQTEALAAESTTEPEHTVAMEGLDVPSATAPFADDVTDGIAPTAPFVPENAPEHATPNLSQLLVDSATDVDTKMEDAVEDSAASIPTPAPEDTSAPVLDATSTETNGTGEASQDHPQELVASQIIDLADSSAVPSPEAVASSGTVRPREDDDADEPSAKRSRVEGQDEAQDASQPEFKVPEVPEKGDAAVPTTNGHITTSVAPEKPTYSASPMTPAQKQGITDRIKNLKKVKSAFWFLRPVDYVTLNIPSYPEIIKQPMDLGTMERKFKENAYASVAEFVADFELILANAITFNGPQHAVTVSAQSMEAYFRRQLETLPGPDAPVPQKVVTKASPAVKPQPPQQRESRSAAATTRSPIRGEAFALQPDGTPQIRRDSAGGRPARTIRPPASRELPYAKPRRKEHQLELKFCEHVLDELRSAKYKNCNVPFLVPVDPVALNIPHYRSVIKEPMDMQTMSQKLKTGQYGKASEFAKDFNLIIQNCITFNPEGNVVRNMGNSLKAAFDKFWATKSKWEKKNQPASQRASSASGDESDAEESGEDDEQEDPIAMIASLTKQLADLHDSLAAVTGRTAAAKPATRKKSKSKPTSKKLGNVSTAPIRAKTTKNKRVRQVTYDEKQEISSAVDRMTAEQSDVLTRIITDNCAKYRDMGDEMELEIDDLPNELQLTLLTHVRKVFKTKAAAVSSPEDVAAADDEDFEPERAPRGGEGNKRKKNKPMGKKEQIDNINNLRQQIARFDAQKAGVSASQSPAAHQPDPETSGDDESEESEEE